MGALFDMVEIERRCSLMCLSSESMFDEAGWSTQCEMESGEAAKFCGLSHDIYVDLFSPAIERAASRLLPEHRQLALQIARGWGYATLSEREESKLWNARNGYCRHGIELGCCPGGCGSD